MLARDGVAALAVLASVTILASCAGTDLECGDYRGPRNALLVLDRAGGSLLRTQRAPDARFLSHDGDRLRASRSVDRQGEDELRVVATIPLRGTASGSDDGAAGRRVTVGTITVEQFARSGVDERQGIRAVDGDGRLLWELPVTGGGRIGAADADAVAVIDDVDERRAQLQLVSLADGEVRWTADLSGSVIDATVLTDQEVGTLVGTPTFGCG